MDAARAVWPDLEPMVFDGQNASLLYYPTHAAFVQPFHHRAGLEHNGDLEHPKRCAPHRAARAFVEYDGRTGVLPRVAAARHAARGAATPDADHAGVDPRDGRRSRGAKPQSRLGGRRRNRAWSHCPELPEGLGLRSGDRAAHRKQLWQARDDDIDRPDRGDPPSWTEARRAGLGVRCQSKFDRARISGSQRCDGTGGAGSGARR